MREFSRWLLALAIVSIATVNTLGVVGHLYPEICRQGAQTDQKECSRLQVALALGGWINEKSPAIQALSAIAVASFTLVLMRVGRRQVDIAGRQEQISSNQTVAAYLQARAFVSVESFTVSHGRDNSGRITSLKLVAVLRNYGVTPTKRMLSNIKVEFLDNSESSLFSYRPDYQSATSAVLGPQAMCYIVSDEIPVHKFGTTRNMIVWGWTEYDDIFPNTERHRTEFCNRLEPLHTWDKAASEDNPFSYSIYGPHNGSDKECMHKPRRA